MELVTQDMEKLRRKQQQKQANREMNQLPDESREDELVYCARNPIEN